MRKLVQINRETVLYVLFGALTSAANLATYFVCEMVFEINYLLSNAIAWVVTVVFSYVTNKRYVFQSDCETRKELLKEFLLFVNSRVISGVADIALMWLLVGFFGMNSSIVKFINSAVVVALNYVLSKLFIFKEEEKPQDKGAPQA